MIEWLAMAVGIAGGLALSYGVGNSVLPPLVHRSRRPDVVIKLSLGGTIVAAVPAVLLSILIGAPLGMRWGAAGMAGGVAVVFALVVLAGAFAGVLLGKLLTRPEA